MFKNFPWMRLFKLIVYLLIIVQCSVVAILAINHSPFFDFDESNTINISKQSVPKIFEVLSYEQNFPAYYVFLHGLFTLGADFKLLIVVQYCLWLLSIYFFWKLVQKTSNDELIQGWVTLLYCFCSAIWKYTFYIRMYMLSIVVTELLLLTVFALPQKNKFRIYLILFLSVILCSLHPGGIIFTAVLSGSLLIFKQHRIEALGIIVFSAVTTWFNFFLKPDVFHTFSSGIEYIKVQEETAVSFIARLFFETDTVFLAYPFLLLVIIVCLVKASKMSSVSWFKSPLDFYLITAMITIAFIAIGVDTNSVPIKTRHVLSYIVPALLFLASITSALKPVGKIVVLLLLTAIIFSQSSISHKRLVAFEKNQTDFCQTAQNVQTKTIVTSFRMINGLTHCLKHRPEKLLLVSRSGVDNVTQYTAQELLVFQAKNGGSITPGYLDLYEAHMARFPQDLKPLSEDMSKELAGSDTFIYVVTLNSPPPLPQAQEKMFVKYTIKGFASPAFYIFGADNLDKKE